MARTWLSVTVELLGGAGQELWPWPGRMFAVGPGHTFGELAEAINDAFARWDRSHLSVFTLADGRVVTDEETGAELATVGAGPVLVPLDMAATKVARTLQPGAEFQFTFDLGDNWTHRCVLGEQKIDPLEMLGIRPAVPLPYFGWGAIPDQYGRRWAQDDGEGRVPRRPSQPHPMRLHAWPARTQLPALDLTAVRRAIARADADGFLAAVTGRDIDDALQQVGAGIPMALEHRRTEAEPVALSVINRLTSRGGSGDEILAEDLLAALRREPLAGPVLPVDLEMLATVLETDPAVVGQDAAIDVEEGPDRWLRLEPTGSREGWRDMAAFAARQHDHTLRARLEQAIQGHGAFARFRDLVYEEGLAEPWSVFSTDRQIGRARGVLADHDLRAG
ncbi:hypothetical protein E7744_02160 [Citricoccus sp. SGAir0253]|uniref:hypothetical protein n=1 Tax=Citricoccus sp. SGAir0253 TaxID=2567881 RepID=UPI0010CD6155|nr:hypothetical protein [Citricoccus sp. SGAir0253]QCU77153.1 hypothetical protein E7744_02160 [Citricoccus sp. SGAir0253]